MCVCVILDIWCSSTFPAVSFSIIWWRRVGWHPKRLEGFSVRLFRHSTSAIRTPSAIVIWRWVRPTVDNVRFLTSDFLLFFSRRIYCWTTRTISKLRTLAWHRFSPWGSCWRRHAARPIMHVPKSFAYVDEFHFAATDRKTLKFSTHFLFVGRKVRWTARGRVVMWRYLVCLTSWCSTVRRR